MTEREGIVNGNALQKISSAGFIIGTLLLVIGNLLMPHAANPTSDLQVMLKPLGEHEFSAELSSLLIMTGFWAMLIGMTGVYRSIIARGAAWARLGFYFILVGTAMWTIGMSIADVSYPAAAANWLSASVDGKDAAYIVVTAIPGFTRGLFPMEVIAMWLAFAFLGIGMARSDIYPRWLGWMGLFLGVVGIPLRIMQTFTGRESTLDFFMILNISTILWTLVTGIWVARRAWQRTTGKTLSTPQSLARRLSK